MSAMLLAQQILNGLLDGVYYLLIVLGLSLIPFVLNLIIVGWCIGVLTTGLIIPAQGKRPARKDHREMREQVRALQKQMKEARDDPERFMALTNLLEQACNA